MVVVERPGKERAIEQAIASHDTWQLRELALLEGGFLNDSLRRRAWPLLLSAADGGISGGDEAGAATAAGITTTTAITATHTTKLSTTTSSSCTTSSTSSTTTTTTTTTTLLLSDRDRQTVRWDVDRCHLTRDEKNALIGIIEQSCHFYYQGFHFIAMTIHRIFDHNVERTVDILRRLYRSHFGQYVAHNDLPLVRLVQLMGPPILYCFDQELYDVMDGECTTFSVGPVLTWFATTTASSSSTQTSSSSSSSHHHHHHHQHQDSSNALSRLFDAFVASHPLLPLYLSVALLLQHKPAILADPLQVHQPLLLPSDDDHNEQHGGFGGGGVDGLIGRALDLMSRLPPNRRLWLVASHYYGDGAVEDLLSTASSNSLLRLVAPESYLSSSHYCASSKKPSNETTTTATTSFPRAYIASGRGRPPSSSPKQQKYKKVLAWIFAAVVASLCWSWRRLKMSPTDTTTDITSAVVVVAHDETTTAESSFSSPDPLLVAKKSAASSPPPPLANEEDRDDITAK